MRIRLNPFRTERIRIAVVGPSRSGKSSLMKELAGSFQSYMVDNGLLRGHPSLMQAGMQAIGAEGYLMAESNTDRPCRTSDIPGVKLKAASWRQGKAGVQVLEIPGFALEQNVRKAFERIVLALIGMDNLLFGVTTVSSPQDKDGQKLVFLLGNQEEILRDWDSVPASRNYSLRDDEHPRRYSVYDEVRNLHLRGYTPERQSDGTIVVEKISGKEFFEDFMEYNIDYAMQALLDSLGSLEVPYFKDGQSLKRHGGTMEVDVSAFFYLYYLMHATDVVFCRRITHLPNDIDVSPMLSPEVVDWVSRMPQYCEDNFKMDWQRHYFALTGADGLMPKDYLSGLQAPYSGSRISNKQADSIYLKLYREMIDYLEKEDKPTALRKEGDSLPINFGNTYQGQDALKHLISNLQGNLIERQLIPNKMELSALLPHVFLTSIAVSGSNRIFRPSEEDPSCFPSWHGDCSVHFGSRQLVAALLYRHHLVDIDHWDATIRYICGDQDWNKNQKAV